MKNQKENDYPVMIKSETLNELATLLEAGEIEVKDLSIDLVDAVIDYQFSLQTKKQAQYQFINLNK